MSRPRTPSLPSTRPSRVVVQSPSPAADRDRYAAKATLGEPVPFAVDAFTDGHDHVAAVARVTGPDGDDTTVTVPLTEVGNDRFVGHHRFDETGRFRWTADAWIDRWTTWVAGTTKKIDAGLDVSVEAEIGARLLEEALAAAPGEPAKITKRVKDAIGGLRAGRVTKWSTDPAVAEFMAAHAPREPIAGLGYEVPVVVDRPRARFSAWYEFFPRSTVFPPGSGGTGSDPATHGTLRDAIDRLDHVADLGFDVVYLPPIHPIGTTARKGPNNRIDAGPGDVGSPWAIGSPEGGHTAVHPDLGTVDDLVALTEAALARDMEIALDIAFQCSPDHPWVREHPSWFAHRPDGSIQYAENPPKKYQDIFPLDFESEDWKELWKALRDVFLFWCERGVRIFRVDNPHTKAFAFWEWAIAAVKTRHPDALFLSEAFTRPKVMHHLAKIGFTQSYTYFPWRNTAAELAEYLTETSTETVDWFRPNSWPNTPDILTRHLQEGGRAASVQRAVLAATLTANYGVYGPAFELVDVAPAVAGTEEYLDSEKYQLRRWDLDQPHTLAPVLARLNQIRRAHPALQWDRTLRFHHVDGDSVLCYSKTWPDESGEGIADAVLVVVNVDPHHLHEATVHLDLEALGLDDATPYRLHDLLGGETYEWQGASNYVSLDPGGLTAHVFAVELPQTDSPEAPR